jgi:hypothetical protein
MDFESVSKGSEKLKLKKKWELMLPLQKNKCKSNQRLKPIENTKKLQKMYFC